MPMSFPDMQSLINRAEQRGFRRPLKAETEEEFRNALADHMLHIDRVESAEIRSGKGWDKQDPRAMLSAMGLDLKGLGL
ncbi:hypothetical protein Illi2_00031 [Pseudomonas phage vB_PpuM-Illi-2]